MAAEEDSELEEAARRLQERIIEDLRRTCSPAVIDHWQHPRNFKTLDSPDGYAKNTGSCGDTMEMFLRVRNQTVVECAFQTDGCGTTIVCGSAASELATGRSLIEVLGAVSAAEILRVLGGLPDESVHCAQLAAETLRRALADYLYQKNAPWKRDYRKT
jgi:nitrogen fixation NifU-like protein